MRNIEIDQEELFDIVARAHNIPKHKYKDLRLKIHFDIWDHIAPNRHYPVLIDKYITDIEHPDKNSWEHQCGYININAVRGSLSMIGYRHDSATKPPSTFLELEKKFPSYDNDGKIIPEPDIIARDRSKEWLSSPQAAIKMVNEGKLEEKEEAET